MFVCMYMCSHVRTGAHAHVRTHDFSSSVKFIFLMNVFMIEQNERLYIGKLMMTGIPLPFLFGGYEKKQAQTTTI